MHNKSKTKVFAIASGKGGVGKSTLIANMAFLMAQQDLNIVVLDADIGLANMQILFDIKPSLTFFDYINGNAELNDVLLPTQYKNITLCAGKSGYECRVNVNSFVLSRIVREITQLNKYDILLIDTGAGLNEYVQEFLSVADDVLIVTTADPSAITDVYALIKMLSNIKKELLLCLNYTNKNIIGKNITKVLKKIVTIKYIGSIDTNSNIQTAGQLRKLFVQVFQNDKTTLELQNIVNNLIFK
jgi:flagellar biosynthesis protein FlhG